MRLAILAAFTLLLTACQTQEVPPQALLEFRPASYESQPGWETFTLPERDQTLYADPTALITRSDIINARQTRDNSDRLAVKLKLTDAAGDRLYKYTRHHVNEPMAIFLGDELLSAPRILSALRVDVLITGGQNGLTEAQVNAITDD